MSFESADDFDEAAIPKKMMSHGGPELAEHFFKKEWNEKKNKFDYIYPSDIEKNKTRLAIKTMKSSVEGNIPTALRIESPVEKTMNTKERKEIKEGAKHEAEHKKTIKQIESQKVPLQKAEEMIAKDHVKEDPNYYSKLNKMESSEDHDPLYVSNLSDRAKKTFERATTDCAPIRTLETGVKVTPNKGDRMINLMGRVPETAEAPTSDPSRSWKWKEHSYSSRTGTKGHYKYDYGGAKQNDEGLEAERKMQQDKNKTFVPGQSQQNKGSELPQREKNPSLSPERTQQEKANIAKTPGQKLPPQGKPDNIFTPQKPMQIGGIMPNQQQNIMTPQMKTNQQVPPPPTGVNPGDARNGAFPTGQTTGNVKPSETFAQSPLGQFFNTQSVPGNTMPDQARTMGHVFDSRQIGNEDFTKQDDENKNPLSPKNLMLHPEMEARYRDCHRMARAQAQRYGGVKYTTSGRNANFHSMTINPDNTVFDYVLGINGMPLDQYLALVPYSFIPNPN